MTFADEPYIHAWVLSEIAESEVVLDARRADSLLHVRRAAHPAQPTKLGHLKARTISFFKKDAKRIKAAANGRPSLRARFTRRGMREIEAKSSLCSTTTGVWTGVALAEKRICGRRYSGKAEASITGPFPTRTCESNKPALEQVPIF